MLALGVGIELAQIGARGPHGHGAVNDAGKELLSFLTTHQATACSTWFEKKNMHSPSHLAASQVQELVQY